MVFGGTSGITLKIAQDFHARGARVSVASRNADNVQRAVASMSAAPLRIRGYIADIRDEQAVGNALRSAGSSTSARSMCWCKAPPAISFAPRMPSTPNGFKVVVDIDLIGTFNVMRRAYEYLVKPGACVINITAPQSYIPMRFQIHACAAKAGVDQVTRVLALEWGAEGIRVNSIAPGPIADTEGVRRLMPGTGAGDPRDSAVPLGAPGTEARYCKLGALSRPRRTVPSSQAL